MIRENPASRGTETSAEVLVGPPLGAGGWSETPEVSKIHADTACRVPLRDAPSAAVAASLSREGAVNADRSPRPSLLHPLHSGKVSPACPVPRTHFGHHLPCTSPPLSPTTTPEPLPLLPLCPTALYHAMLWYTPSMRTRVPSFGQTFPNKVGPCRIERGCQKEPNLERVARVSARRGRWPASSSRCSRRR